jgi:large subunit ribosomal protein L7/L12
MDKETKKYLKKFAKKRANEVYDISQDELEQLVIDGAKWAFSIKRGEPLKIANEKTEFDVILNSAGNSKLAVIKLVKDFTGLDLKSAKKLVDGAPIAIKEGISKMAAEDIKSSLIEEGAYVVIK